MVPKIEGFTLRCEKCNTDKIHVCVDSDLHGAELTIMCLNTKCNNRYDSGLVDYLIQEAEWEE